MTSTFRHMTAAGADQRVGVRRIADALKRQHALLVS
jgi:hypothetical protein